MKSIAALFSVLAVSVLPISASADFYRYYDEVGNINVTNDYKSIPDRYRKSVTVTTERQLEKKVKARERQVRIDNASVEQRQQSQQSGHLVPNHGVPSEQNSDAASVGVSADTNWLSRQLPMLKVMGVIALLTAGFVVVGRAVSSFAPRSLAIVIKIAMIAAIGVFLTKGFSEKIADAFARIKEESNVAQKAVDKRGYKIQQQAD